MRQLFQGMESALLSDMENESTIWRFQEGEQLMHPGHYLRNMFFITKGLVKVYREDNDGAEFFMYYIKPGQACALSIACTERNEISTVRAIAVEETDALMVSYTNMEEWLMQYKSWGRFVIDTFRHRLEEVLLAFDNVAFRGLDERIEFYLKRQCRETQSKTLTISHQDIANDLNTSREVVSRLLKKLEQHGKIIMLRHAIEVLEL
ncbi:MAG: Crp/Fnr family transcriptional regulator [Saprospiraceae bacterium]|nr:Crp/Fnr family transcriptional regulator [Saprospiraceae bacterium]